MRQRRGGQRAWARGNRGVEGSNGVQGSRVWRSGPEGAPAHVPPEEMVGFESGRGAEIIRDYSRRIGILAQRSRCGDLGDTRILSRQNTSRYGEYDRVHI